MTVQEIEQWYSDEFKRITGEAVKPPASHVLRVMLECSKMSAVRKAELAITSDPRWIERACRSKAERKSLRLGTLAPPEGQRSTRIVYLVKGEDKE
jgi:hypothetical protein